MSGQMTSALAMKELMDKTHEALSKPPINTHLPEGKEAFGFLVHEGEHLPVVRNEPMPSSIPLAFYSYTVWQNGVAWTENFSQIDWDRFIELGEAYEVTGE